LKFAFKYFYNTILLQYKDLGIHIDKSLKFSSHVNQIVAKAHARASLIHECFLSKIEIYQRSECVDKCLHIVLLQYLALIRN